MASTVFRLACILCATILFQQTLLVSGNATCSCCINTKIVCPDGWEAYGTEKCFKIFLERKSFVEAQQYCRQLSSNLASIHSVEENNFLVAYILRDLSTSQLEGFWLGGMKKGPVWFWLDLSPYGYVNWVPGNPVRDCLMLATGVSDFNIGASHFGKIWTPFCTNPPTPFICQK